MGAAGAQKTEGGRFERPEFGLSFDYVGDVIASDGTVQYGLCSNHADAEPYFQSASYKNFLLDHGG